MRASLQATKIFGTADVAHALLRAAPRLVSAHGEASAGPGRPDESGRGTLKRAPRWHRNAFALFQESFLR